MKKVIVSLCAVALTLTATSITFSANDQQIPKKSLKSESKVYICTSKGSYAYHAGRNCEFLLKCSVKLNSMTMQKADSVSRRPCKGCIK